MSSVRIWAGALACLGVVVMSDAWAGGGVSAQQKPAAPPAAVVGNVEHGRYIVESIAHCAECHSTRDSEGNIIESTRFHGGPMPARVPWPADWPVMVPPIAGLPGYSDEQAVRLLTEGAIRRNGTRARAPMPRFRMTPQDAADVIAFMRAR
ncbi:MAG: c-type cytochrome [Vicinamibacterales bacterium]